MTTLTYSLPPPSRGIGVQLRMPGGNSMPGQGRCLALQGRQIIRWRRRLMALGLDAAGASSFL
ncbi:hypothetical protein CCM_08400 [Cordyceps militaris CM01]|uniref:Uncharacterized protein n=1 Tax=Cordyceps militaris (strain CM01) TaxID=983644 RepID=G3JR61_CORMM|nr:uncharacterized protein CCM_08400 [Cordyceps militaris CM01]EGX88357.1 hypothetical protein CCM_08400 [Cordyceps militaris CM01]